MTVVLSCDLCGNEIHTRDFARVVVKRHGIAASTAVSGDYCPGCWRSLSDAVSLLRQTGADLRSIPIASEHAVSAARSGHRFAEDLRPLPLGQLKAATRKTLLMASILTVEHLDSLSDEQILAIPGMGPTKLLQARAAAAEARREVTP